MISGSLSERSRLEAVLTHLDRLLQEAGYSVVWIRARDIPPHELLSGMADSELLLEAQVRLAKAELVVVATPVYKASYTGLLKAFLDLLPQHSLSGKVVLPVAMGGTLAHLLMIDYALRPVLVALGAEQVLHGVYTLDSAVEWHGDAPHIRDRDVLQRLETAVERLSLLEIKGGIKA
ncbi:MAG: NADPH-dependent FMN reductase [Alicyclobacillus sp.]|nr:NADPH-dependent FMN reductase [Alicyclobacillus sp.]